MKLLVFSLILSLSLKPTFLQQLAIQSTANEQTNTANEEDSIEFGGMSKLLDDYYDSEPSQEDLNNLFLSCFCVYSENEIKELERITQAEIGDGTTEQKRNVVRCILDRTRDKDFPDTIHDVIFQPVQFSTVRPGCRYWTQEVTQHTKDAVLLELMNYDDTRTKYARFFVMHGYHSPFHESLEFAYGDGEHDFYY